ncbi:MAG TPA: hypothetical protein VN706_15190 [Gemmatimonadaceae bacterium]|nr:hypothetical protein [Gemmatimonadaceae bacterium]
MAGIRLDSTGQIKLKTLDEALLHLQRIHGLVEQYAIALKNNQATSAFVMNIRRQLPTLAANLKNQFGMISDQVVAVNLSASRGASEQVRLRGLREGVAQVKQALEIAITQTKDKHKVVDDAHGGAQGGPHAPPKRADGA